MNERLYVCWSFTALLGIEERHHHLQHISFDGGILLDPGFKDGCPGGVDIALVLELHNFSEVH